MQVFDSAAAGLGRPSALFQPHHTLMGMRYIMYVKAITRATTFLVVLLTFAVYAFGQRETGTITGTVTDPSGAVVSGATVTTKSASTGAVRTTTTTNAGAYTIAGLPPGQ